MEIVKIPINEIIVKDRKTSMEDSLDELVESIKRSGEVIPPIKVNMENDQYVLVAGLRRFEAAKIARLKEIEAEIVE